MLASAFLFVPLETIHAQCGGLFNPTAFLGVGLLHYSIGLLLWRSLGRLPCGRILWCMVNRLLMLGSACLLDV